MIRSHAQLGMLEPGEVIDVKEACRLLQGTVRVRCMAGWVNLESFLLEKLDGEESAQVSFLAVCTSRNTVQLYKVANV
jgi:hypothetical protein